MAFFPYTCKACSKPGMVEIPDEDLEACGKFRPIIEGWVRFIVHDRCAIFLRFKQRIYTAVAYTLDYLEKGKWKWDEDEAALKREAKRLFLVGLTQKYNACLCRHYKVGYQWEPFIVDQLMANPNGSTALLRTVERGIRRLSI